MAKYPEVKPVSKKKYTEIKDLTHLSIDVLDELEKHSEYVIRTYTITTSGGRNRLWAVNDKKEGQFFTVSTGEQKKIRVNPYVTVPEYKHYVLSPEGVNFVKGLVMEASI